MTPDQPDASATTPANTSTTALASFLRALSPGGQATTPLPELGPDLRQVAPGEDLVARFTQAATAAGTRVHRAGAGEWVSALCAILHACGAQSVFVAPPAGPTWTAKRVGELVAALRAQGMTVHSAPDDATLFAVDAAITGVSAAIAATGTLVCTSGPQMARGSSLIPPVHCALVGTGQLVPDLYDYLADLGAPGELPANVNLISGPSKTADIEGVLVTGVHGPGELHAVLLDA